MHWFMYGVKKKKKMQNSSLSERSGRVGEARIQLEEKLRELGHIPRVGVQIAIDEPRHASISSARQIVRGLLVKCTREHILFDSVPSTSGHRAIDGCATAECLETIVRCETCLVRGTDQKSSR